MAKYGRKPKKFAGAETSRSREYGGGRVRGKALKKAATEALKRWSEGVYFGNTPKITQSKSAEMYSRYFSL